MKATDLCRVAIAIGVLASAAVAGSVTVAAGSVAVAGPATVGPSSGGPVTPSSGVPDWRGVVRDRATGVDGASPVVHGESPTEGGGPPLAPAGVDPPEGADAVLRNGTVHFLGQVLYTDAFGVGDDVDLERPDGSFVTDVPLRDDGSLYLRTGRLDPGEYVLTDNADSSIRFELVPQEYALTVSNRSVRNGGDRTTTRLSITSNRIGYTHVVSSPTLSATRLREVLGTGVVRDVDGDGTGELVIEGGRTEQSFTADFRAVPAGNYTVEFSVPDTRANASATVEVGVYPPGDVSLGAGDEELRIQQASGRLIGGTSTLPPGTRLRITVTNDGGQAFRRSTEVRVRDDGTFGARFDFSGIPRGQRFTVTVTQDDAVRATAAGVVVAPAALSVDDYRSPGGDTVAIGAAVLPEGGFVAVRTAERGFVGASDYLEPGTHRNVEVPLDRPLATGTTVVAVSIHRDTDGDRRFEFATDPAVDDPYERAGVAVQKSMRVTVPRTPTPSPTPTPTGTARPSPTTTGTPTATPTATTTSPATTTTLDSAGGAGGPGFGPAVALLALAALAILAARRTNR